MTTNYGNLMTIVLTTIFLKLISCKIQIELLNFPFSGTLHRWAVANTHMIGAIANGTSLSLYYYNFTTRGNPVFLNKSVPLSADVIQTFSQDIPTYFCVRFEDASTQKITKLSSPNIPGSCYNQASIFTYFRVTSSCYGQSVDIFFYTELTSNISNIKSSFGYAFPTSIQSGIPLLFFQQVYNTKNNQIYFAYLNQSDNQKYIRMNKVVNLTNSANLTFLFSAKYPNLTSLDTIGDYLAITTPTYVQVRNTTYSTNYILIQQIIITGSNPNGVTITKSILLGDTIMLKLSNGTLCQYGIMTGALMDCKDFSLVFPGGFNVTRFGIDGVFVFNNSASYIGNCSTTIVCVGGCVNCPVGYYLSPILQCLFGTNNATNSTSNSTNSTNTTTNLTTNTSNNTNSTNTSSNSTSNSSTNTNTSSNTSSNTTFNSSTNTSSNISSNSSSNSSTNTTMPNNSNANTSNSSYSNNSSLNISTFVSPKPHMISIILGNTLSFSSLRVGFHYLIQIMIFIEDMWLFKFYANRTYPYLMNLCLQEIDIITQLKVVPSYTQQFKRYLSDLSCVEQNKRYLHTARTDLQDFKGINYDQIYFLEATKQLYTINFAFLTIYFICLMIWRKLLYRVKDKCNLLRQLYKETKKKTKWWVLSVMIIQSNLYKISFYSFNQMSIMGMFSYENKLNMVITLIVFFVLVVYSLCYYSLIHNYNPGSSKLLIIHTKRFQQSSEKSCLDSFKVYLLQNLTIGGFRCIKVFAHSNIIINHTYKLTYLIACDGCIAIYLIYMRSYIYRKDYFIFVVGYQLAMMGLELCFLTFFNGSESQQQIYIVITVFVAFLIILVSIKTLLLLYISMRETFKYLFNKKRSINPIEKQPKSRSKHEKIKNDFAKSTSPALRKNIVICSQNKLKLNKVCLATIRKKNPLSQYQINQNARYNQKKIQKSKSNQKKEKEIKQNKKGNLCKSNKNKHKVGRTEKALNNNQKLNVNFKDNCLENFNEQ